MQSASVIRFLRSHAFNLPRVSGSENKQKIVQRIPRHRVLSMQNRIFQRHFMRPVEAESIENLLRVHHIVSSTTTVLFQA